MEKSSQDFIQIQDIREGVVILKNGGIRGILMVSSINFALKSAEEQSSTIYAFQNFLNSLDFSAQIVVQSRAINITPYLDGIKKLQEKQENELLRAQTGAYADFIQELVENNIIMTKNFYVVVPYSVMEILGAGKAAKQKFFKSSKKQEFSDEDFERLRSQLWQRMEFLAMGLKRCGLDVMPLTTPEIIELFWAVHHPNEAEIGYYPKILPELLK